MYCISGSKITESILRLRDGCRRSSLKLWDTHAGLYICEKTIDPSHKSHNALKQISYNASFCNRNVHTCAHFWYKMVHCGIWDWCIVEYVPQVYSANNNMDKETNAFTWVRKYISNCVYWLTLHSDLCNDILGLEISMKIQSHNLFKLVEFLDILHIRSLVQTYFSVACSSICFSNWNFYACYQMLKYQITSIKYCKVKRTYYFENNAILSTKRNKGIFTCSNQAISYVVLNFDYNSQRWHFLLPSFHWKIPFSSK